jgi:nucleotide-binding universal stress UspA family protein
MNSSRQLIVAYDGSAPAHTALAHAADLADPGGIVTVVNVIAYQAISARIEQASDAQRDRQEEVLREAERFLTRRGITAHVVGAIGDPAFEILRIAKETKADMIVVGRCRGHTLHLRGSLSMKLARSATCDVLVVHAADRSSAPL